MKKISRDKRERLIRLQRKREHKRITRKKNFIRIRKEYIDLDIIQAPQVFSIQQDPPRNNLLKFIDRLRRKIMIDQRSVRINFSTTERMFADGTLLFYAELDRLNRIKPPGIKIKAIPPRNKKVSEVLKQIGIYNIVGQPRYPIHPSSDDVVHWRKATGKEVVGEKYNDILDRYDGIIPEELTTKLYIGITEAMANCVHHAYIDKREDGIDIENLERRWWMFSQSRNKELSVVFCDLGVGIPKTLPKTKQDLWKKIVSLVPGKKTEDGTIIKEAVEDSRSRTGESHRGKGLSQLVDFIHDQGKMNKSRVTIFSNFGAIQKIAGEEGYTVKNYGESIFGTLIQWTMPIREENE